ncbi:NAD(P)H-hydrate dehydratase [Yoonia sp.]|uniref:NAD(P)H-hydrate dehydratase n=1 Tax=Yoonia sp. TaxID=2212373 RepID=UPI003F6A5FF8
MTELLTAAQMRAIEQAAIASGKVTGLDLMERAGRGVVTAIFHAWPALAPSWGPAPKPPEYLLQDDERGRDRAVILCGPGNNGGDGFVVARLLKEAGWDVEVFLYGHREKLPPDALVNYDRWREVGDVLPLEDDSPPDFRGKSIVIDALFGTGLARPVDDLNFVLRAVCDCVDAGGGQSVQDRQPYWPPVVAIDMPSGVCSDSGRVLGDPDARQHSGARAWCAAADLTVTFHSRKIGQLVSAGPRHAGKVIVIDIDLKTSAEQRKEAVRLVQPRGGMNKRHGHKYSHGHAFILSGGVGHGGAARLAARGALRIGAGAVTLGCPPAALIENAAQLNAVMLRRVRDADDLAEVLADRRINALCLGPGLGVGPREAGLVMAVLGGEGPRPTVLDADALTLLAEDNALFGALHDRCVLTPHAGEFARLFPDIAAKLDAPAAKGPAYSKVDATRDAAARAGCVVLFKGPDTVIADPSGRCGINASVYDRSAPWLATAGSGDVLAGFIAGLLARGFPPMRAAETGAWLHTECALQFGPGLIAEDLPEVLPQVFRALGL